MAEVPVYRIRTERMDPDRFAAIGAHLGVRGEVVATDEALYARDRDRALAFAQPGSRLAGLLFFTDQSQGMAQVPDRLPDAEQAQAWTQEFVDRFRLGPGAARDGQVHVSFGIRASTATSAVEEGGEAGTAGGPVRHVPIATEVHAELRVGDVAVTGPRARLRLTFKNARAPLWVHRGLWASLEVFDSRPLLSEDEAYRRLAEGAARRGDTRRPWRLLGMRLVYLAGEFAGGPDLLAPSYLAEIEMRDPNEPAQLRQGPRRLVQIAAVG